MLRCPIKEAKETRKTALVKFRKEGRKKRIPQKVVDRIHTLLTHYMQGQVGRIATTQDHALKAVTDKHKHNWTGTTAARVFSKRMVEHNGRKGNRATGA